MTSCERSLFDDLDEVLRIGSSDKRVDGLLIPCKVADCRWDTVGAILATKLPTGSAPKPGQEKLEIDFEKLSRPNAERLLRFWQVREVTARSA